MIDELRLTIDDLKSRRNVLAAIVEKLDEAIVFLQRIFAAESDGPAPAQVPPSEPPPDISTIGKTKQIADDIRHDLQREYPPVPHVILREADTPKKTPGTKGHFSQYKGVSDGGVRKDGIQRYKATVFLDKKNKTLGTFLIEEEAAAAVQDALGNKAAVNRFQAISKQKTADQAEQKENNPDRTPPKKREIGNKKPQMGPRKGVGAGRPHNYSKPRQTRAAKKMRLQIAQGADPPEQSELASMGGLPPASHAARCWVCSKCGAQDLQKKEPKVCRVCFEYHGFHEIK